MLPRLEWPPLGWVFGRKRKIPPRDDDGENSETWFFGLLEVEFPCVEPDVSFVVLAFFVACYSVEAFNFSAKTRKPGRNFSSFSISLMLRFLTDRDDKNLSPLKLSI